MTLCSPQTAIVCYPGLFRYSLFVPCFCPKRSSDLASPWCSNICCGIVVLFLVLINPHHGVVPARGALP